MKILAIAQARMGSTRVPGKVMRVLENKPVLHWTIEALQKSIANRVCLATSTLPADDVIEEYCKKNNIEYFRGSETDVLDRFYQCAKQYNADIVLRLTCDCPFLDIGTINEVIKLREMTNADYASNCYPPTYPDGLDVECFTFKTLERVHAEATNQTDRDCLTQFIVRNRQRFKVVNLTCPLPGLVKERWVLDTEADWGLCKFIADKLGRASFSYVDILNILDKYPEARKLNAGGIRNERFYESLSTERLPARTFAESDRVFKRAIQTIPYGAQTFSKSHVQFPAGRSPLFVSHADGCRIFDVDGNDYVDLVNAIMPVVLGYCDPDVDESIRRQLDNGISFSLATTLEAELSELLCRHIPCAEMVKFGKSGTDVTSAAIRLARAYTGKDHILLSGYHGWADWSIACTDRNAGIPHDVKGLSHRIKYGDKNSVEWWKTCLPNQIAAVIVEPNDDPKYLAWLRQFCTNNGIILIFDEIITGFRYSLGGAQELFGVTPDLACFGKAMANGMPISALVGRRDIMKKMNSPDVFYSGTFFGETLSIAAAIATINKLERENVIPCLWESGEYLTEQIESEIEAKNLSNYIKITGLPPKKNIEFIGSTSPSVSPDQLRTLFMKEMIQQGVLIIASNNLSFAHKKPELKRIMTAYAHTLGCIRDCLQREDIADHLGGPVVSATPLRATT